MLKLLLYTRLTNTSKIWAWFSFYIGIFGHDLVFISIWHYTGPTTGYLVTNTVKTNPVYFLSRVYLLNVYFFIARVLLMDAMVCSSPTLMFECLATSEQ